MTSLKHIKAPNHRTQDWLAFRRYCKGKGFSYNVFRICYARLAAFVNFVYTKALRWRSEAKSNLKNREDAKRNFDKNFSNDKYFLSTRKDHKFLQEQYRQRSAIELKTGCLLP